MVFIAASTKRDALMSFNSASECNKNQSPFKARSVPYTEPGLSRYFFTEFQIKISYLLPKMSSQIIYKTELLYL